MCTVTWIHEPDGYQMFCNRDEKLTRQPSSPPQFGTRDGVRFLAPSDGDFGGAWIATNEFGLTLCLLNGANLSCTEGAANRQGRRSRGLLIPELMGAYSAMCVAECVSTRDLSAFAPFTLAVLEPARSAVIVEWNGCDRLVLPYGDAYLPLASSSFDGGPARARRRQEYLRVTGSGPTPAIRSLLEFHRSHAGGPGPYSTCMHRPDAQTVSFTRVRVTGSQASVFHSPAAPCKRARGTTVKLDRRQPGTTREAVM